MIPAIAAREPAVQDGILSMSNGIVLSQSIRSSLLTLQNTAEMQTKVQERLATGKKVNSALDNPTNFFTAASLNRRGNDLSSLLDAMSNGIKTLEAADTGMTSITKVVETMRAYVRQARQDKSFKGLSYTHDTAAITAGGTVKNLSFSGGAVGTTPVNVALNSAATAATLTGTVAVANDAALQAFAGQTITVTAGANTVSYAITGASTRAQLTTALSASGFTAAFDGSNNLAITRADGTNFTVSAAGGTSLGFAGAGATSTDGVASVAQTVDQLVTSINGNVSLADKIRASNDGGKLRIENLSTENLSVVGASATAVNGGTGGGNTTAVGGNEVRKSLIAQFNELRRQLDKIAGDSGFNGVNLLKADKLKVIFNESGTSLLEIQAQGRERQRPRHQHGPELARYRRRRRDRVQRRRRARRAPRQALEFAHRRPDAGLVLRLEPRDRADPSGIHQDDDQHAPDRRRQPDARRHERGGRQPARPQHPPAAVADRAVARRAKPRRRCCGSSANRPERRSRHDPEGRAQAGRADHRRHRRDPQRRDPRALPHRGRGADPAREGHPDAGDRRQPGQEDLPRRPAHVSDRRPPAHHAFYFPLVQDFLKAAPSALPLIAEINNRILTGDLYKALKAVKQLIAYEQELIAHATGGDRVRQGGAGDPVARVSSKPRS